MARTSPPGFDTDELMARVEATYARVARDPTGEFHFHRGLDYAVELLGYDRAALEALPADSTEAFAGVGNPLRMGAMPAGAVVLDVGCGAGMDLLLAATQVGPTGRAIGVDMTEGMRERVRAAARAAGLDERVEVRAGTMADLPVEDASVDVVISNGVLNLATDKLVALAELARVLVPGGRLQIADVGVSRELTLQARSDVDLWAA